jgi:uncharacterized protein
MEFEWDEAKRQTNLNKHGLDFVRADLLFEGNHLIGPAKMVGGEQRWMATGIIQDGYATVIFTRRNEIIRIISFRRARDGEKRRYQALFGG